MRPHSAGSDEAAKWTHSGGPGAPIDRAVTNLPIHAPFHGLSFGSFGQSAHHAVLFSAKLAVSGRRDGRSCRPQSRQFLTSVV